MTELHRLPIWHRDGIRAVDLAPIKEAKARLELDFKVMPVPAKIDIDERILAVGGHPPFLCDHALWSGRTGSEGLVDALRWVLTDEEDPRATTIVDMLCKYLPGTREMTKDELDSEHRMYVYLNRIE